MPVTLTAESVSRTIPATPDALYAVVSDVTRTPELSPEIVACEWVDGASPVVGARFRAVNKVRRGPKWTNTPEVVAAERGREFAFARREKAAGELVWRYRFEPVDGGTLVTESYEVTRPVPRLMMLVMRVVFGERDRRATMRAGMEQTLARLEEVVSRTPASPPPAAR